MMYKTCENCKYYECVHYKGTPEDELYDECTYRNEVLHDVEICGNFEEKDD